MTWTPSTVLGGAVSAAGFLYEPKRKGDKRAEGDLIYSKIHPWQRSFGYTWPMDVAAPFAIHGVLDCETIYFKFGSRKWLIELWKGQYGMERGAEIGIYRRKKRKIVDAISHRFKHWFPKAKKQIDDLNDKVDHWDYYWVDDVCEWKTSFELLDVKTMW